MMDFFVEVREDAQAEIKKLEQNGIPIILISPKKFHDGQLPIRLPKNITNQSGWKEFAEKLLSLGINADTNQGPLQINGKVTRISMHIPTESKKHGPASLYSTIKNSSQILNTSRPVDLSRFRKG